MGNPAAWLKSVFSKETPSFSFVVSNHHKSARFGMSDVSIVSVHIQIEVGRRAR